MVFYPLTDFVRRMDSVIVELKAKLQERLIKKGMAWQRFFNHVQTSSAPPSDQFQLAAIVRVGHGRGAKRDHGERQRSHQNARVLTRYKTLSDWRHTVRVTNLDWSMPRLPRTRPANIFLLGLMDFRYYFKIPLQLDQNYNADTVRSIWLDITYSDERLYSCQFSLYLTHTKFQGLEPNVASTTTRGYFLSEHISENYSMH